MNNCVQGPEEQMEDYLDRREKTHARSALDYDKRQKAYEYIRGLNKDLAAKVGASLRHFNSLIKIVNALPSFDRNRRTGDS